MARAETARTELSEVEKKKEKERFLMFTRVLMKYLEQRDRSMFEKAKAVIKLCYEKNKSGNPEFENLFQSVRQKGLQNKNGSDGDEEE